MKTTMALSLAAALAAAPFAARAEEAPAAPARPGPYAGARGPRGRGPRLYDPKTVTTVSGKVAAVQTVSGRRGGGIHLDLETAEGTLRVHLGPSWFLEKEGLRLAAGDQVEITGSKVTVRGQPAVIAQVVKKGDTAVALRDVQGIPVWAGRGAR
jgi:hypothetical protein